MTLSFALAGVDDAEAILDLQKLTYQSEAELYGDFAIPPLLLEEMRKDLRTQTVVKASGDDGGSVASARADEANGTASIGRVIVPPRLQGQGIGQYGCPKSYFRQSSCSFCSAVSQIASCCVCCYSDVQAGWVLG